MSRYQSMSSGDRQNQWRLWPALLTRLHGISLFIGVVAGLCLGLLIGWNLWPVEWGNAWPGDLSLEAKAQYLAAIAEAYTYYRDEGAVRVARSRLFDLSDEDLAAEIAAARQFFADNPQIHNSSIYINNLNLLAAALNIQPDIQPGVQPNEASAAAPTSAAAGIVEPAALQRWLRWTLITIAAVVLVGGGLYILNRLSSRRSVGEFEEEEFDDQFDEAPMAQPLSTSPTDDYVYVAADTSEARYRPPSSGAPSGSKLAAGIDDYGFRAETDEMPGLQYANSRFSDNLAETEEELHGESHIEAIEIEDSENVEVEDVEDDATDSDQWEVAEADLDKPTTPPEASITNHRASETPAAPRPVQRMAAQGVILSKFTTHYQIGLADYDESYNIVEPESGRYIGECGMGVNIKNGILQNNPENVIALDIWLFDKADDKSLGNQTRVLLSEFVIDNDLEPAFTKERPNDPPPVVAQPGIKFQLKSQQLLLDCEIVEATYTKNSPFIGIFQSVKVEMTVRRKS